MDKLKLSLNPEDRNPEAPPVSPVSGYLAVAFGILGIFTYGYVFVPLALICSIVALFKGHVFLAITGLFLTVIGLLTSPVLLAALGLGALAIFVDLPPS